MTMSSDRVVLSVEELTEPQLRRLVQILQISHPDAVAYALALIEPSTPSSNSRSATEEKKDSSNVVSAAPIETQADPRNEVVASTSSPEAEGESATPIVDAPDNAPDDTQAQVETMAVKPNEEPSHQKGSEAAGTELKEEETPVGPNEDDIPVHVPEQSENDVKNETPRELEDMEQSTSPATASTEEKDEAKTEEEQSTDAPKPAAETAETTDSAPDEDLHGASTDVGIENLEPDQHAAREPETTIVETEPTETVPEKETSAEPQGAETEQETTCSAVGQEHTDAVEPAEDTLQEETVMVDQDRSGMEVEAEKQVKGGDPEPLRTEPLEEAEAPRIDSQRQFTAGDPATDAGEADDIGAPEPLETGKEDEAVPDTTTEPKNQVDPENAEETKAPAEFVEQSTVVVDPEPLGGEGEKQTVQDDTEATGNVDTTSDPSPPSEVAAPAPEEPKKKKKRPPGKKRPPKPKRDGTDGAVEQQESLPQEEEEEKEAVEELVVPQVTTSSNDDEEEAVEVALMETVRSAPDPEPVVPEVTVNDEEEEVVEVKATDSALKEIFRSAPDPPDAPSEGHQRYIPKTPVSSVDPPDHNEIRAATKARESATMAPKSAPESSISETTDSPPVTTATDPPDESEAKPAASNLEPTPAKPKSGAAAESSEPEAQSPPLETPTTDRGGNEDTKPTTPRVTPPEIELVEDAANDKPKKKRPSGKKRPPGKKRDGGNSATASAPPPVSTPSSSVPPNHSVESNEASTPSSSRRDPPPDPTPRRSDHAQARGSVTHEVIAWKSDRADADTEDSFGHFFDGYSANARSFDDASPEASADTGCYLMYDSEGGGKLVLQYSRTKVSKAVGFYRPGEGYSIQGFKYDRNHGRVELIKNCASGLAGRRNYMSGWCQYLRAAKDLNATVWIYPPVDGNGLPVDIYVFLRASLPISSVLLPENTPCCISEVEAVACLPKFAEFIANVRVALSKWMEMGNAIGCTMQLTDGKKPVPDIEGLYIPGKSPAVKRNAAPVASAGEGSSVEDMGCYLVYDADGCKMIQHYSKTRVPEAIGFYSPGPGQKIPGFKFKSNQGRSELIGNCSGGVVGRKNYYSGWCQFVRAAKAMHGSVRVYPRREGQSGLDVDLYTFTNKPAAGAHQTIKLQENAVFNISNINAVACLPKHAEFFEGLTMDVTRWVEEGSKIGATIQV